MKSLHRPDLFSWSTFDAERNVDFHGLCWVRAAGNVLIDPLPMSPHDLAHLQQLGGVAWILITNSDHTRAAQELAAQFGAQIAGPAAEAQSFPLACARWLSDGDQPFEGLKVLALDGSKTPGELAFLLDETTLITGDLIRAHRAGALMLLPDAKLSNKQAALASLARLTQLPTVQAVLVGDGWQVFAGGAELLKHLLVQRQLG